ncbi:MAG: DMT family transporter [Patescibacteria group bacterium]
MLWALLGLGTAFSESLKGAVTKVAALKNDSWTVGFYSRSTAASLLLITVLLSGQYFVINARFLWAFGISLTINAITSYLYIDVLRHADISHVMPLVTLSPVFMLVTGPLINNEWPTWLGAVGVLLTVFGTMVAHAQRAHRSPLDPLRELAKIPGTRQMLLVAFLWSVSSPFDKIAAQASTPLWYVVSMNAGLALVFYIAMRITRQRHASSHERPALLPVMSIGFFEAIIGAFQITAITLAPVTYVIALKRASVLFSMAWARLFFHETNIGKRAIGALITFVGLLCILFAR